MEIQGREEKVKRVRMETAGVVGTAGAKEKDSRFISAIRAKDFKQFFSLASNEK